MLLVVLAHLLLRQSVKLAHEHGIVKPTVIARVLFSALLFGLGTAFRWNIGVYGAIIFLDVIILHMHYQNIPFGLQSIRKLFSAPVLSYVVWGVLALVCAVLAIFLSGYNFTDIQLQLSNVETAYDSIGIGTAKNLLPLITPAFGLLAAAGFLLLLAEKVRSCGF